jgi:putative holliday junction resolvase
MALDLGARRIGVALSDESQTLATPFETVVRMSFAALLDRLAHIAAAENVESLVVGLPLSLNGELGPQARHVTAESARIRECLQLPVVFWDERLSTVSAEQMLAESGGRRPAHGARRRRGASSRSKKFTRKRQAIDAIVAAMILQEYLNACHVTNEPRGGEGQP